MLLQKSTEVAPYVVLHVQPTKATQHTALQLTKLSASFSSLMRSVVATYRGRQYPLQIPASRLEEHAAEYAAFQSRPTVADAAFAHGQFAEIMSAMQCVFGTSVPADASSMVRIRRAYGSKFVSFHLPVVAFFHCTVVIEELFLGEDVRQRQLSIEELRTRCRSIFVPCSAYTPAIYTWGQLWVLPSSLPRPVASWSALAARLCAARCVVSASASKASFRRIWDTCTETIVSTQSTTLISCRAFGRQWSLTVPTEDGVTVRLLVEDLLQQLPPDSAQMQQLWNRLCEQHAVASQISIPTAVAYDSQAWTYTVVPGAWEHPVHMHRMLQQLVLLVERQRHVPSFGAGFVIGLVTAPRLGQLILGSMVALSHIVRLCWLQMGVTGRKPWIQRRCVTA